MSSGQRELLHEYDSPNLKKEGWRWGLGKWAGQRKLTGTLCMRRKPIQNQLSERDQGKTCEQASKQTKVDTKGTKMCV